jgi:hypothetical protein
MHTGNRRMQTNMDHISCRQQRSFLNENMHEIYSQDAGEDPEGSVYS